MYRFLFYFLIAGAVWYLLRNAFTKKEFRRCQKCDGKGYWRATRGEQTTCDYCGGSGKVRNQ